MDMNLALQTCSEIHTNDNMFCFGDFRGKIHCVKEFESVNDVECGALLATFVVQLGGRTVSYTHLTLPTKLEV